MVATLRGLQLLSIELDKQAVQECEHYRGPAVMQTAQKPDTDMHDCNITL